MNRKRVLRMAREDNLLCVAKPARTCMGILVSSVFRCRQLSFYLFKFLCSVGGAVSLPGLHPGSEPRGAAVNIAVGTAGGSAKRC